MLSNCALFGLLAFKELNTAFQSREKKGTIIKEQKHYPLSD